MCPCSRHSPISVRFLLQDTVARGVRGACAGRGISGRDYERWRRAENGECLLRAPSPRHSSRRSSTPDCRTAGIARRCPTLCHDTGGSPDHGNSVDLLMPRWRGRRRRWPKATAVTMWTAKGASRNNTSSTGSTGRSRRENVENSNRRRSSECRPSEQSRAACSSCGGVEARSHGQPRRYQSPWARDAAWRQRPAHSQSDELDLSAERFGRLKQPHMMESTPN